MKAFFAHPCAKYHKGATRSNKIFLFRIIYRKSASLDKITSVVESVDGVKIQRLNLISKGKKIVGTIAVKVSTMFAFDRVLSLVSRNRDIFEVEKLADDYCCAKF